MFRVKICGITHRPDAFVATALGADAIGLNFVEGSRRYLPPSLAGNVAAAIPSGVAKIGVFVNSPAEDVGRLSDRLRLDFVQLSGDEPPDYLATLRGHTVIKTIRFGSQGLRPLELFLKQTRKRNCLPSQILIDADQPGEFGGTGTTVDWERLRHELEQSDFADLPLILAGGLTPENVADAIAAVRPAAVDVASGVEHAPGRKDADRVDRFIRAANAALDRLQPE
jgi:phosphoribosylanthranilate isomerase